MAQIDEIKQLQSAVDQNLDILAEDPSNPNWKTAFEANENGMSLNWSYFNITK